MRKQPVYVAVDHSKSKKARFSVGWRRVGIAVLLLVPLLVPLIHFAHSKRSFQSIPELSPEYDPSAALNIESYTSNLQAPVPKISQNSLAPPSSFLAKYQATPRQCKFKPHRLHLRLALDKLRAVNKYALPPSLHDAKTLHVQVVCGPHPTGRRHSIEKSFLKEAAVLARGFEHATVIPIRAAGVSPEECMADVSTLVGYLKPANRGVERPSVLFAESVDHHLLLSASAKHLMLHRGPHSALSGLLSLNQVYTGKTMADFANRDAFQWLLSHHNRLPIRPRAPQRAHLDAMGPVVPSCCDLRGFGFGDGAKVMCANAASFPKPAGTSSKNCWVLSLGCGGKWSFEQGIVLRTDCHIHTFDCTRDFKVPKSLRDRVTLHKKCVGQRGSDRFDGFLGWKEMLDLVRNSTPGLPRMPSTVKMDIEGWEVPVLDELIATRTKLPEQIAMEIHNGHSTKYGRGFADPEATRKWFAKMEEAGYRLVHRADNPYCEKCSEVTIVQAKALPVVL